MAGGAERILLDVALILVAAKIGGELARRIGQPPVLGEIIMGVALGPSLLHWLPTFSLGSVDPRVEVLAFLAELGVLILLFEVGLETQFADLRKTGASAAVVGILGVVISLAVGFATSYLLATRIGWVLTPEALAQPLMFHVFVGAVLTATSIGITARVLNDLRKLRTPEGKVILGAAVFDDILGLIVLAIVGGIIVNPGTFSALSIAQVFAIALGFFFAAILIGRALGPRVVDGFHRVMRDDNIHVGVALVIMLLFSYLATYFELAAIVGAFAAGLGLSGSVHRHHMFQDLKPVGSLFIGFFFVTLGARVDLSQIGASTLPLVLLVGGLLTVGGILGKLAAGLGVVGIKANRLVVGVGMVPRGEVGLIFALYGLQYKLFENWQYATIILVCLLTTLVTPPWLQALRGRFGPVDEDVERPRVQETVNV